MRSYLVRGIACVAIISSNIIAGNYILTIDGQKYEIDAGKETTLKLTDGRKIQVNLEQKEYVIFRTENFSFEHPSDIVPARTDLGKGIHQTMMSSPVGTLVLVQEYADMDPSSLVDMMLNELTKEEKKYGYKISNSSAKVKLASGSVLTGKKSIASYKGKKTLRQVLCYSLRDAGYMIVTQVADDASSKDRAMVAAFWKSLELF